MISKAVKSLVAIAFAIVVLWLFSEESNSSPVAKPVSVKMAVTTMLVTPEQQYVLIETTGVSQPRWPLTLKSMIVGKVKDAKVAIQPGSFVAKGQVLAEIDDSEYQAHLSQTQARLFQAKLELARLRHEQTVLTQVNLEQKSEGRALTPYGRLEPHVTAAEGEMQAAQMALQAAQVKLQQTIITAPFDAVVLDKSLMPEQWLEHGDAIYHLAHSQYLDVRAELTSKQWQKLANGEDIKGIEIQQPNGKFHDASVRYIEPSLSTGTRQQGVLFEVTAPYEKASGLIPGQQYDVLISGGEQKHVVSAPASALTRDLTVWTVLQGELKEEAIELLDEQATSIRFRFKQRPALQRELVLYPLSTMLDGQLVKAEQKVKS